MIVLTFVSDGSDVSIDPEQIQYITNTIKHGGCIVHLRGNKVLPVMETQDVVRAEWRRWNGEPAE